MLLNGEKLKRRILKKIFKRDYRIMLMKQSLKTQINKLNLLKKKKLLFLKNLMKELLKKKVSKWMKNGKH